MITNNFLFAGIYFFTVKYFTRTCGPLSLCGPTTISLVRNGEVFKKFSRNISSQKSHDFDMVNCNVNSSKVSVQNSIKSMLSKITKKNFRSIQIHLNKTLKNY